MYFKFKFLDLGVRACCPLKLLHLRFFLISCVKSFYGRFSTTTKNNPSFQQATVSITNAIKKSIIKPLPTSELLPILYLFQSVEG